jgi:hypothetical protein
LNLRPQRPERCALTGLRYSPRRSKIPQDQGTRNSLGGRRERRMFHNLIPHRGAAQVVVAGYNAVGQFCTPRNATDPHVSPWGPMSFGMVCARMIARVDFGEYARVAQRIERHRPKVGVGGSSPSAGTDPGPADAAHTSRDSSIAAGELNPPPPGSQLQAQEGARRWRFRSGATA